MGPPNFLRFSRADRCQTEAETIYLYSEALHSVPAVMAVTTTGPKPETDQRFGLQNNFESILSPEIALEWVSRPDSGCNRHCKTNPVDLEGSRGQVLVVWGGCWRGWEGGGGKINFPLWPKAAHVKMTIRSLPRDPPGVGWRAPGPRHLPEARGHPLPQAAGPGSRVHSGRRTNPSFISI